MTFVTENPLSLYAILGVIALLCVIAFFTTKRVKYLGFVGGLLALALAVALIDHFVETDREAVERRTYELAKAAELGDFEKFATYVSDDFYALNMNREAYLRLARTFILPAEKRQFVVWNLQVTDSRRAPGRELDCLFSAKATGSFRGMEDHPVRLELAFKKDADGQWRVRAFRLLSAFNDDELPLPR